MRVSIKFSDLRKIEDNNDYLKEKVEDLNLKLDSAIANEKNFISDIKQKDSEIFNLKFDLECFKETEEENTVLIAENERLKKLTDRAQPKFWFGDRVKNNNDDFIIDTIFYCKETGCYYYSSIDIDGSIAEIRLEVADEKI